MRNYTLQFRLFSSYMAEAKNTQQQQQHNNECRPESLSPWRANDEGSAIQFLEYTSTARIVNYRERENSDNKLISDSTTFSSIMDERELQKAHKIAYISSI